MTSEMRQQREKLPRLNTDFIQIMGRHHDHKERNRYRSGAEAMSFLECKRCGGIPGVTACCSDTKRAALSAAKPVAWVHTITEPDGRKESLLSRSDANPWSHWIESHAVKCIYAAIPLYAAPPAPAVATVPLSDEQIRVALKIPENMRVGNIIRSIARAIEAAHGIIAKDEK